MSGPVAAIIDDVLERAAEARERVADIVRRAATRAGALGSSGEGRSTRDGKPQAERSRRRWLGRRLKRETPYAASLLIDALLNATPAEAKLILGLLGDIPDQLAMRRVERMLGRSDLPGDARHRLEAARLKLMDGLPSRSGLPARTPRALVSAPVESMSGPELWRRAAGAHWRRKPAAELGRVWLDRVHPLSQGERQAALANAARDWDGSSEAGAGRPFPLTSALELEAHWGGKQMSRWVAKFLADRRDPASLSLLRRLAFHRDASIRALAVSALDPVPREALQRLREPAPADILHHCFLSGFGAAETAPRPQDAGHPNPFGVGTDDHSAPLAGQGNLLISRRDPDTGRSRYALFMIDLEERGVVECWGDLEVEPDEFRAFLDACNTAQPTDPLRRVPAPLALLLANGAAALALRRGYVLPKEYFLWRDIFVTEACEARQYRVAFGGGGAGNADAWEDLKARDPERDEPTPW
jgi:hypothetical protein